MDTGLTKHQYLLIREFVNCEASYNLFPSYEKILKFKTLRYPNNIYIDIDETYAEVDLQSLLDNTASSILELQKEWIENCLGKTENNLRLIGKWGFDGSTGHSEYKQKFTNCNDDDISLFVTSYVPLRLVTASDSKLVRKNPRPSSIRYCRPIRLQFKKETVTLFIEEEQYFKKQLKANRVRNFQQ